MRRYKIRPPHIVDLDEILAWVDREEVIAASSSVEPKRLYVRLAGGYRVTVRDIEVYRGQNAGDAVNAYNTAV